VNRTYQRWSLTGKARFHRYFADAFRDHDRRVEPGEWPIEFVGKRVRMMLRKDRMWLDWDSALSIAGYDVHVKVTYAHCLGSDQPPEVFFDAGANYGLHSLLFLAHDVETVTFEPNPECHDDFRALCELNGLSPRLEAVALGDRPGDALLAYPERETWLGTTRPDHPPEPETLTPGELRHVQVPRRTLDNYRELIAGRRGLVKIDTEGTEDEVLAGGSRMLEIDRPLVIFESLAGPDRPRLSSLLTEAGYGIGALPWDPGNPGPHLDEGAFLRSTDQNFIAVPRG
jgi:FkbM family methyltransferase